MTDEPITEKQIKELLAEGKLPNLIRWHHYKSITACSMAIEDTLTKLEKMGFSTFDFYYALRLHTFYTRFALEDGGASKAADEIDEEIGKDMYEHRKKYTIEAMQLGKYDHKTRPEGSSEEIQP